MYCKAVQRETPGWKQPWHEQRGTVVLSPTHGADLATKTKTEKSSDYDTQRDTLTLFPVGDPLLHHIFTGKKKNVLQYWCPKNLETLLHYLYVRMLIPFSAALFIVGSYLCTINTRPTFSTAIKQNFRWKEIHSVQPGSRGPFHLTPHFSSRFCYHLTQWRASSFWRASCWNSICSLLEKSQFCSTAGPTRVFFVA